MDKRKIILIDGYHGTSFNFHLAKELISIGSKVIIATPNIWFNKFYSNNNINTFYLESKGKVSFVFAKNKLINILSDLGIPDPLEFIKTEKAYYGVNDVILLNATLNFYYSVYEMLSVNENILIVQGQGGELYRRVIAHFCSKLNNVTGVFLGESFLEDNMTIYRDEFKNFLYPHESKGRIDYNKFIERTIKNRKVFKYSFQLGFPKHSSFGKYLYLILKANHIVLFNFINHKIKSTIGYYFRYYFQMFVIRPPKANFERSFVFYPLNVPAESELFVRNPKFANQVEAIKRICDNLPDGYLLYVKQHPGKEGLLSISDVKKLKGIKNCVIIETATNTYDLIEASKAVIISSSSVGFESYIMRKPTIVVGNWPYTSLGNFIVIKDLKHLKNIRSDIDNFENECNPIKFLQNIDSVSYDGSVFNNIQNLKKLTRELLRLADS